MSTEEKPTQLVPDTSKMEYRYLGNTGLRVSVLSYGNWCDHDDDKRTVECVKSSLEHGVNFFDTAEIYGLGLAEKSLGKALKELKVPREKIVISTKIFKNGNDPNDTFQSRKHIIEGVKQSLKRLQLDYVDIVFCHRYDMITPLEETCRAMNFVINQGWAFYWGTSEWRADQIERAIKVCEKLNLIPPIVEQCEYNMLMREKMDSEFSDLFRLHGMGTTIFSPLKGGILTGKYLNEVPEGTRVAKMDFMKQLYEKEKDNFNPKILKLKELAEKKLNCTLPQLAVAWVIANKDVSTCILGASKVSQLNENFTALEVYKKLTPELLTEIETILDNCPKGEMDFRNRVQLNVRRNIDLGVDLVKK
jgi:voltage-dependent potassium channel beta subunit